jgi:hypothetical protein
MKMLGRQRIASNAIQIYRLTFSALRRPEKKPSSPNPDLLVPLAEAIH